MDHGVSQLKYRKAKHNISNKYPTPVIVIEYFNCTRHLGAVTPPTSFILHMVRTQDRISLVYLISAFHKSTVPRDTLFGKKSENDKIGKVTLTENGNIDFALKINRYWYL